MGLTDDEWQSSAIDILEAITWGYLDRPDILLDFARRAVERLNKTTGSQYRLVSPKKLGGGPVKPHIETNVNQMSFPVKDEYLIGLRKVPETYTGSKFTYDGLWYPREEIVGQKIRLGSLTKPPSLAGKAALVTGVGPKRVQVVMDEPLSDSHPSPDGVHVYLTYQCLVGILET